MLDLYALIDPAHVNDDSVIFIYTSTNAYNHWIEEYFNLYLTNFISHFVGYVEVEY